MPRCYSKDNDPDDYCADCWDTVDKTDDCPRSGHDHPPYCDTEYDCKECGKALRCRDD
jgi:hypothetical protein